MKTVEVGAADRKWIGIMSALQASYPDSTGKVSPRLHHHELIVTIW